MHQQQVLAAPILLHVVRLELIFFIGLARKSAHHAHAGQVLLQRRGKDRFLLLERFVPLTDASEEEELEGGDTRVMLKLHPTLAPYKVAVLPLIKKLHSEKAQEVYELLSKHFMCDFDESASIGKRYRRQDEVGTPFCVTVDDETINNGTVTIRHRDTMEQEVVSLNELVDYVNKRLTF